MKKTIVTGASGFIGRAMVRKLAEDHDVETLALSRGEVSDPALTGLCSWAVTDYSCDSLRGLLSGADTIIHLAGIKGTRTGLSDYDEDMRMTENILRAAADCGAGRVIYASSRLVYGDPDKCPWTEDTEPDPRMAYAVNKLRCEDLCMKYAEKHGFEAVCVRIAQVLGIGEGTRNMINVFQDTARAGGEIKVMGRSVARRQYIYNHDVAGIIYRLAAADRTGSFIMNAGMARAYTNLEIAELVNRAFGNPTPIRYDDSSPETIRDSIMDVTLMRQKTGYEPLDMEQALAEMSASEEPLA